MDILATFSLLTTDWYSKVWEILISHINRIVTCKQTWQLYLAKQLQLFSPDESWMVKNVHHLKLRHHPLLVLARTMHDLGSKVAS